MYNILLKNVYIGNKPTKMKLNACLMENINDFCIGVIIGIGMMLLIVCKNLAICTTRQHISGGAETEKLKSSQESKRVLSIPPYRRNLSIKAATV